MSSIYGTAIILALRTEHYDKKTSERDIFRKFVDTCPNQRNTYQRQRTLLYRANRIRYRPPRHCPPESDYLGNDIQNAASLLRADGGVRTASRVRDTCLLHDRDARKLRTESEYNRYKPRIHDRQNSPRQRKNIESPQPRRSNRAKPFVAAACLTSTNSRYIVGNCRRVRRLLPPDKQQSIRLPLPYGVVRRKDAGQRDGAIGNGSLRYHLRTSRRIRRSGDNTRRWCNLRPVCFRQLQHSNCHSTIPAACRMRHRTSTRRDGIRYCRLQECKNPYCRRRVFCRHHQRAGGTTCMAHRTNKTCGSNQCRTSENSYQYRMVQATLPAKRDFGR